MLLYKKIIQYGYIRLNDVSVSYLIPRTDYTARKHEEVTHGNQAGPDDQGENT